MKKSETLSDVFHHIVQIIGKSLEGGYSLTLAEEIIVFIMAVLELNLLKDPEDPNISFWLSGEDNLKEVMTVDNPTPYIAFTKKLSDKIYEGSFFGYLYGYTEAPSSGGNLLQDYIIKFKEKLLSITIILP